MINRKLITILCIIVLLLSACSNQTSNNTDSISNKPLNEEIKIIIDSNQKTDKSAKELVTSNTRSEDTTTNKVSAVNNIISGDDKNILIKDKVNQIVESFVKDKKFKGSILIGYKGEILLNVAFGKANIDKDIDNSVDTRFMIASMTKQFAAMSILILQERGQLSVKDNINKYIPELPMSDKITIHQLLTHTSGLPIFLPDSRRDYCLKKYPGTTNNEKIINGINKGDIKVVFPPPGSIFNYSDINYMIVGDIIEKVSGITFEDFLKQNIFIPLEMDNSGVGYYPNENSKLAIGYGPTGNTLFAGLSCSDMGCGAGAMYSTVEDLYKWDRAIYAEKMVHKKSLEAMFTRYYNTYGYGWWFSETSKGIIPVHGGRLLNRSFSGFYVRNSIDDICVIILGNDGNHDDKRDFAMKVNSVLIE